MKSSSYLLILDSTAQSRVCATFAWKLAAVTGASVVAQHVVDSAAVWRFLSFETTGFVGSGVFMEARERIIAVLHSIADALVLSYESLAEGSGVSAETLVDEGDTVTEIARRSKEYDLVICGGRREGDGQLQFFERLVHACSCPILIVRGPQKPCSKLQVLAMREVLEFTRDANVNLIGKTLGLPIEIQTDEVLACSDGSMMAERSSTVLDERTLRRGTLKELLRVATDDVLMIIPPSAVAESKLTRGPRVIKRSAARSDFQLTSVATDAEPGEGAQKRSRFVS